MITYKDIIKDEHIDLRKKCERVELPLSEEDEKTLYLMRREEFIYIYLFVNLKQLIM